MINKILKKFKQFKLSNSYFRSSYRISNETKLNILKDELEYRIRHNFVESFSSYVYNQHNSAIQELDESKDLDCQQPFTRYELNLMVFKLKDFKTIIEAVIQELSDKQIYDIKHGSS